jgi:hypothetical protein
MGSKKRRNRECVYCGKVGPITDDHIPPECLFAEDDRQNLIKVPSCLKCNREASKDDEYFRLLTLREDVNHHPDVQAIPPILMRSLKKPEAMRFRSNVYRELTRVQPRTPAGLVLPARGALKLNRRRLFRVIERITKGLFYDLRGRRLPDAYDVNVSAPSTMTDKTEDELKWFAENVLEPLGRKTGIMVGRGVFLFKVVFADIDPNCSIWLYLFYGRIPFFALTGPRQIQTEA